MTKLEFISLINATKELMSKRDKLCYFTQRELDEQLSEQIEKNVNIIDNLVHSDNELYFNIVEKMDFIY